MPDIDPTQIGLLLTALALGLRHGFDWDHIAAIADITSTSGVTDLAERSHAREHAVRAHRHGHGGQEELLVHGVESEPESGAQWESGSKSESESEWEWESESESEWEWESESESEWESEVAPRTGGMLRLERRAMVLGTLYALGHALVVAILGGAALLLGTQLPDWIDPLMGRVVGLTLVLLGIWVFVSLYNYVRHGTEFRLRSRWMLVFDGVRYAWRRFQARLHGHEHVEPLEMSSYGARTALGVGMIHGIGAETATQVLFIAAIGGADAAGLGIPMMLAFIVGLVLTNTLIVVVSASGFVASQLRRQLYVVVGALAGTLSLIVGAAFLLGVESALPDLQRLLGA